VPRFRRLYLIDRRLIAVVVYAAIAGGGRKDEDPAWIAMVHEEYLWRIFRSTCDTVKPHGPRLATQISVVFI
jgi:hypothetical protein